MKEKSATLILAKHYLEAAGSPKSILVAGLVGIPASSLREALRGESYLGSEREAEIQKIASKLAKLKRALDPLGLPRDVADVKALMQSKKSPVEIRQIVNDILGREDVIPFDAENEQ
jgi:hypothetical protein